jgi:uncharacterized coiled-coil protein SlyX
MRMTSVGNIGIGTTSPAGALDVYSGANEGLLVDSSTVSVPYTTASSSFLTGALVVAGGLGVNGNINGAGSIYGGGTNGGNYSSSSGTGQFPPGGQKLSMSNSAANDSSYALLLLESKNTSGKNQYGYIALPSVTGASQYTPAMTFGLSTGSSSYQEYMRIDSTGNVGIGTTSPAGLLDVEGTGTILLNSGNTQIGVNTLSNNGTGGLSFDSAGRALIQGISGATLNALTLRNTGGGVGDGVGISFQDVSGVTGGQITTLYTAATNNTAMTFSTMAASTLAEQMRIINNGNVGVGTISPGYRLDVNGDINIESTNALRFAGTSVCTSAGCTSSSDRTLKENIQPLQDSLDKVLKLQGVEYDYKDKAKFTNKHQIGVIAQDVEKIYPEVVNTDSKTGLKAVAYDHLVAPLIEAFKALHNRVVGIETQQATQDHQLARVDARAAKLEAANAAQEKEIAALKAKVAKAERENADVRARLEKIEKVLNSK